MDLFQVTILYNDNSTKAKKEEQLVYFTLRTPLYFLSLHLMHVTCFIKPLLQPHRKLLKQHLLNSSAFPWLLIFIYQPLNVPSFIYLSFPISFINPPSISIHTALSTTLAFIAPFPLSSTSTYLLLLPVIFIVPLSPSPSISIELSPQLISKEVYIQVSSKGLGLVSKQAMDFITVEAVVLLALLRLQVTRVMEQASVVQWEQVLVKLVVEVIGNCKLMELQVQAVKEELKVFAIDKEQQVNLELVVEQQVSTMLKEVDSGSWMAFLMQMVGTEVLMVSATIKDLKALIALEGFQVYLLVVVWVLQLGLLLASQELELEVQLHSQG